MIKEEKDLKKTKDPKIWMKISQYLFIVGLNCFHFDAHLSRRGRKHVITVATESPASVNDVEVKKYIGEA